MQFTWVEKQDFLDVENYDRKKKKEQYVSGESIFSLSMNLSIILNIDHKKQDVTSTLAILLFHPSKGEGSIYSNLLQFYR